MVTTNKQKSTISFLLAIFIVFTFLSGCKPEVKFEDAEYTYLVHQITFPRDIGEISNLAYFDDKVYFVASEISPPYTLEDYELFINAAIYSMSIDGTELTKLECYIPSNYKSNETCGIVRICDITVDNSGYIWIVELWDYFIFNLPLGHDPEEIDLWEYKETINSGYVIRKLASDGAELLNIDIAAIDGFVQYSIINNIAIISADNNDDEILLSTSDRNNGKSSIQVIDTEGIIKISCEINSREIELIKTPSVVIISTVEGALYTLDIKSGLLSNLSLFPEYENTLKTLDFSNFGMEKSDISDINLLPNENIVFLNSQKLYQGRQRAKLVILKKTLLSEIPEKIVLTLGGYYIDRSLFNAVNDFNENNPYYNIEILDYTDDNNTLRFLHDITSGNIPDIIDLGGDFLKEYIPSGFFVDLYPFIDSDPELSRSDFVQGYLLATEVDGKLYRVQSAFALRTIIGDSYVLGSEMGWNLDDIITVLDANPNVDMPIGGNDFSDLTKLQYIYAIAIPIFINDFINWETNTVDFTNPQFIKHLKLIDRLYKNVPEVEHSNFADVANSVNNGHQIMKCEDVIDPSRLRFLKILFGDNYVFKGFPNITASNSHHLFIPLNFTALAITDNSQHKEVAWSFVRTILDADWQIDNILAFPTNQIAFNEMMERHLLDTNTYVVNNVLIEDPLTYSDIDKINDLVNSVSDLTVYDDALYSIVAESVIDYYNGLISAERAAQIIQDRVLIYLSEQS